MCVNQTLPLCRELGFTSTYDWAWFGDTVQDSINQFNEWAMPGLEGDCADTAAFFYCGTFFPPCSEDDDPDANFKMPCRQYCEDVMEPTKCPSNKLPMDCSTYEEYTYCTHPKDSLDIKCVPLDFPPCSSFGYNHTSFPNFWNDRDADAAKKNYYTYGETAVSPGCSADVMFYVCSVLFPACDGNGHVKRPCRRFCDEVNAGCAPHNIFRQACEDISDPDESTCLAPPPKKGCPADQFPCVNVDNCVPMSAVCNKQNDCGDWSDERQCTCNTEFEVKCGMGMCIPSYHRCDTSFECPDMSDEINCVCPMRQYNCEGGTPKCIMHEWLCDGDLDCEYGDDEAYCDRCSASEYTCKDQTCIPSAQFCDGVVHCPDQTDEMDCVYHNPDPIYIQIGPLKDHNNMFPVCQEGFTNEHGQSTCHHVGQGDFYNMRPREAEMEHMLMFFKMNPNGKEVSVLGRGDLVSTCGSNTRIITVDCLPKECGQPSFTLANNIINGHDASQGSWPWLISLQDYGIHKCGGAIVDPYFVLTAAHCVDKYVTFDKLTVLAGSIDRTTKGATGQEFSVRRVIIHPDYYHLEGHDIAMIELRRPITYNDYIKPLCFPKKTDLFTRANKCFIAGWGHTKGINGSTARIQQETKISLWDTKKCNSSYMWDGKLLANDMCAGFFNGLIAACSGDSGSPVMCRDRTSAWVSVGVASYVYKSCSVPTKPMVFTPTLPYLDWIKNNTRCVFTCNNTYCLFDESMLCNTVDDCGDNSDEINICPVNPSCTFFDDFLCGYKSTWDFVTDKPDMNRLPLYDRTLGGYPGYFLAGMRPDTELKSPRIDLTTHHCMRFHYHMRGKVNRYMPIYLHELSSRLWEVVWKNPKYSFPAPDLWLMGYFDLPPGHYDMSIRPSEKKRFALDDFKLIEGTCDDMRCLPGEMQCNTYQYMNCIPKALKCNLVINCDATADEEDCDDDTEYRCDFNNGLLCGFQQETEDADTGEWKLVNATDLPNGLMDHTTGTLLGKLLKISTLFMLEKDQAVMWFVIKLKPHLDYCLHMYYASTSPATFQITLESPEPPESRQLLHMTDYVTTQWMPAQATITALGGRGTARLNVTVIGGPLGAHSLKQYIMIDDISIVPGACPPLDCPHDSILCEGEGFCLPNNQVCDRIVDCKSGVDETNCECTDTEFRCQSGLCIPDSLVCDQVPDCLEGSDEGEVCEAKRSASCDFEQKFVCGYTVTSSSSDGYSWQHTSGSHENVLTGPQGDHTRYDGGEDEGYYFVADPSHPGSTTALTSPSLVSKGTGLVFYYHATYRLKDMGYTGTLKMVVRTEDTGDMTDMWSTQADTLAGWKSHCVNLPLGEITLYFIAQQGDEEKTIFAVDDVLHLNTSCDDFYTEGGVTLDPMDNVTDEPTDLQCNNDESPCTNGACLKTYLFCDGHLDCEDGSDEDDCPTPASP